MKLVFNIMLILVFISIDVFMVYKIIKYIKGIMHMKKDKHALIRVLTIALVIVTLVSICLSSIYV